MSNNSSFIPEMYDCSTSKVSPLVGAAFSFTKATLHLPLFTFILYLGAQKWKQQRSFRTASHSEVFTYHQAAFTVLGVVAFLIHFCTARRSLRIPPWLSLFFNMSMYGENYIQVLTCVEQYLAVVHPIVYMKLRNSRGVRIRNISIGCVWVLSLVTSAFVSVYIKHDFPFIYMVPFAFCLVVVSFCCLSVLCVLIRPGPGEGTRVDSSKHRAFNTIAAITVVLVLWLGGILISYTFYTKLPIYLEVKCAIAIMAYWFNLPSGLVLPLLYLHRAGKLSFCCLNNG